MLRCVPELMYGTANGFPTVNAFSKVIEYIMDGFLQYIRTSTLCFTYFPVFTVYYLVGKSGWYYFIYTVCWSAMTFRRCP